jgi:hypothetical protein
MKNEINMLFSTIISNSIIDTLFIKFIGVMKI